jgi:hypothetical protein
MRQNSTVVTAWSYSDINRLYNYEVGEFNGIRFCESNMVPSFTGFTAGLNASTTALVASGGTLANATTYSVQITGTDGQNQFESQVYGIVTLAATVNAVSSIAVTVPNVAGFTYTVYVAPNSATMAGASIGVLSAGTASAGPTTGAYAGLATQLAPGASVVIAAATGALRQPPAAPANGITTYATFVIGRGAYGQVQLDDVKFTYLKEADKSDPLNQLRVVGWKTFYGTLIENQNFFMRIESVSAFGGGQRGFDNNVLQPS